LQRLGSGWAADAPEAIVNLHDQSSTAQHRATQSARGSYG